MKQPLTNKAVISLLDFLLVMRPFEGTSTIDGKTEFILFWAIYVRAPIPDLLNECYWISARWIPKDLMDDFTNPLKAIPESYISQNYKEWAYYQKEMPSSNIHKGYNEMLEKSAQIKNMYFQIKRIIDYTIDYLNNHLGNGGIDEENIKTYLNLYLQSDLFEETLQKIKASSKDKKGKIEKKKKSDT